MLLTLVYVGVNQTKHCWNPSNQALLESLKPCAAGIPPNCLLFDGVGGF
jgi:hypothetical protein